MKQSAKRIAAMLTILLTGWFFGAVLGSNANDGDWAASFAGSAIASAVIVGLLFAMLVMFRCAEFLLTGVES